MTTTIIAPTVDLALRSVVRLGIVTAKPVAVRFSSPALLAEIAALEKDLCQRFGDREPAAISELTPARELYHAFGIDPTRTRPSSEALLRRILKHKPFPVVNNAVDWCNLAAVQSHLSLGLYDSDKISGAVELRVGRFGEAYPGIRKDEVHLEGRPVLADAIGPFGNPTSDSLRTAVSNATRALLLVVFAPMSYDEHELASCCRLIADGLERHMSDIGTKPQTNIALRP